MRHKSTCASLQEVDLSNSSKGRLGCTCQMPPDLPTRLARKWCRAHLQDVDTSGKVWCQSCEDIAAAVREALEEANETLATAIFWLLRAYESGHRQGWEPGSSVKETMDGLFTFLCNEGFDPNEATTPMFVREIRATLAALNAR